MSRNTVARIDIDAIRHNLAVVRTLAPSSRVACVVKADAYGHGIQRVAMALDDADLLAVATVGEARSVRDAGWSSRLLLLEGFTGPDELRVSRELHADFVVHHARQLELLDGYGSTGGQRIWLKIDTGMHRLGFPPGTLREMYGRVLEAAGQQTPVLMTHFACADNPEDPKTHEQTELFDRVCKGLQGPQSLANSAAVLNFPETCRDYIRPGIMLYGISPIPGRIGVEYGLLPAMTLKCSLLAVNECRAGDSVGYGARFRCPEDMRVGVAGIGYGDGYPRHLRDGTPILVNGRRVSLAGAVSMDLITIDLRGHDEARPGDTVTLWGDGLPVEEVAVWADSIPYELICGVTRRVRRVED